VSEAAETPVSSVGGAPPLLAGYRVLDLADERGAYCTRVLADLGADVIKVEPPGGCASRHLPPFAHDQPDRERGLYHLVYNANKRSITLDLDTASGQALFRALMGTADALVETCAPGTMERRGLGYAVLAAANPRLVYTALSSFGQDGPRRDWQCPEPVLFALGGGLYVSGEPDGEPCAPPGQFAWSVAATFAALATLVALYARGATDRGQYVDVSALECATLVTDSAFSKYGFTGEVQRREGNAYKMITPGGLYPCQDGYVRIVAGQLRHWRALVKWMDTLAPVADPAWEDRGRRNGQRAYVDGLVAEFTARYTRAELFTAGQAAGVPISPVNTPADFVESSFAAARGYFTTLEHPLLGAYRAPGTPYHLDGGVLPVRLPAPLLGQHNAAIYGDELGLPAEALAALAAAGVV
jgi:crotonobetainyl-CoA:carnitine CoA-transferase CaiB-like acyl-CoA transferase